MKPIQNPIHILIVEDNLGDVILLREVLDEAEVNIKKIEQVKDLASAIEYQNNNQPDIIFLDLSLPDCMGVDSFYRLKSHAGKAAVVILTGINDTNVALDAIHNGAQDFLIKGELNPAIITKTILYSVERQRISESLRISNERFNMVALATNDMAWDWDLRSNKIFRSKAGWDKIIGPVHKEEYNHPDALWHRIHPDEKDKNNLEMSLALGSPDATRFQLEYRIRKTDDTYASIIDKGYLIRDDDGNVIRLIGAMQDVTEKRLAEEELKRLSLIAKETINGIIITDVKGNITWVNESLPKITGYQQERILGEELTVFFKCIQVSPIYLRFIRIKMSLKQHFECDLHIIKKDGEVGWLRMQCQPQHDNTHSVNGFFAIITDISKEKIAEENLKQSEKRFRSIIENSTEGLTLVDSQGRVIETSPAAIKITGFNVEDYALPANKILVHPDDQQKVAEAFENILSSPSKVIILEYRFLNKYGNYIWVESTYHNLIHEPAINAVVIHFRNISSRRVFEEILKTSEEKYRNLFNTNPSSILIWNPETLCILEVNEAAINEYGYTKSEFLTMKMPDMLVVGQTREFKNILSRIQRSADGLEGHIMLHKTRDGNVKHMDVSYQVIEYFGKSACLSIMHNVTDKIDLEKKLGEERMKKQQQITAAVITAQEKEREEIGKELHDNINQILATSKLYIEYAMQNESMRENLLVNAKDFIESAVAEIRQLSKTLSPPSLGEVGVEMALRELVESIQKVNKFRFHSDWVDLENVDLSDQLQLTIFRVVQEQINNIIKHAEANNVWIKINHKNRRLYITIRDDGKGFNLAAKKSGVGLRNIQSRAELHNGNMQLKSEPGLGCEMSLLFNMEKPN